LGEEYRSYRKHLREGIAKISIISRGESGKHFADFCPWRLGNKADVAVNESNIRRGEGKEMRENL